MRGTKQQKQSLRLTRRERMEADALKKFCEEIALDFDGFGVYMQLPNRRKETRGVVQVVVLDTDEPIIAFRVSFPQFFSRICDDQEAASGEAAENDHYPTFDAAKSKIGQAIAEFRTAYIQNKQQGA